MELTTRQLGELVRQLGKKNSLGKLLPERHPNIDLAIIIGFDNFSYERYIKGAYFSIQKARRAMAKIKPNGSLPDTYRLTLTTPYLLEATSTHEFDNVDRRLIYHYLQETLT